MSFLRRTWCRVSKRTLHRIGYIITSKPTARKSWVRTLQLKHWSRTGWDCTYQLVSKPPQTSPSAEPVQYSARSCQVWYQWPWRGRSIPRESGQASRDSCTPNSWTAHRMSMFGVLSLAFLYLTTPARRAIALLCWCRSLLLLDLEADVSPSGISFCRMCLKFTGYRWRCWNRRIKRNAGLFSKEYRTMTYIWGSSSLNGGYLGSSKSNGSPKRGKYGLPSQSFLASDIPLKYHWMAWKLPIVGNLHV